jgi:hypothetical protein
MKFSSENILLKRFYENLNSEASIKKDGLVTFIDKVNGALNLIAPTCSKTVEKYIYRLKQSLQNRFEGYWSRRINTSYAKSKVGNNKLRTYSTFKQVFCFENYLNIANADLRKELARFRISAHYLMIEKGRFDGKNKYVPPSKRLCQVCNLGAMEDELHFVLDCPRYLPSRTHLLNQISAKNIHFPNYTREQRFTWLFSNDDLDCQKAVAIYIAESMKLRSQAMST